MMLPQKSNHALWFCIFLSFLFLILEFGFTEFQITQIKSNLISQTPSPIFAPITPIIIPSPTPSPSITPQPSSAANTKTNQVFVNPSPQTKLITYVPLSGGSTQNTDWTNIAGSQFTFNFSDYGSEASAIWDGNLHVDNASGQTFVRIFDTTHSIAVNGSEISTRDSSTSTNVVSGSLSFWRGNNTYVVQIKSLNGSTAFMDSGRIKVTY
jgi:hypothetical protein